MKKLIALLLLFYLLMIPPLTGAEEAPGRYELVTLPEIEESEWPAEIFVARVLRVEIDTRAVSDDNFLRVYLNLPYSNAQVYDILLTDGQTFVHADVETIGDRSLRLTFDALAIRQFKPGAWIYLAVICIA